jgi:hypothetical protein
MLDNTIPCQTTGFTESQLVSNPPEKRIKFNAIMPMNCVIFGLSKIIPPIPSEPASIPIAKKRSKTGMPNLEEVLPARRAKNRRMAPTSNMFSAVKFTWLFSTLPYHMKIKGAS